MKGKPTVIVADTVKGKGVTLFENNVNFHGGSSKYNSAAAQHRNNLVTNKSWTITDGGMI